VLTLALNKVKLWEHLSDEFQSMFTYSGVTTPEVLEYEINSYLCVKTFRCWGCRCLRVLGFAPPALWGVEPPALKPRIVAYMQV